MKDDVSQLGSGAKQLWLREHKGLVLDFLAEFGVKATTKQFHIHPGQEGAETLERLEDYEPLQNSLKFTKADKAILKAEIATEAVRELKQEIAELRERFSQFQKSVANQLVEKFFLPLIRHIEVGDNLVEKPKSDELSLKNMPMLETKPKLMRQVYLSAHPMAQENK